MSMVTEHYVQYIIQRSLSEVYLSTSYHWSVGQLVYTCASILMTDI